MQLGIIEEMMNEHRRELGDRRAVDRTPFVRPVKVAIGRSLQTVHEGCSKDISKNGIAILTQCEWKPNTIATISIHSLKRQNLKVKAELRWCKPSGEGWYISGWSFV